MTPDRWARLGWVAILIVAALVTYGTLRGR